MRFIIYAVATALVCSATGSLGDDSDSRPMDLAIAMNFSVILSQKFPYVTVSHTIKSTPIESIMDFESTVRQSAVKASKDAYNTTVRIRSRSMIIPLMNFNLEQTFENKDSSTGTENMSLIGPFWTVLVQSLWNNKEFSKSAFLLRSIDETLSHALALTYRTMESDDLSNILDQFRKSALEPLINQYLFGLENAPKDEPGDVDISDSKTAKFEL